MGIGGIKSVDLPSVKMIATDTAHFGGAQNESVEVKGKTFEELVFAALDDMNGAQLSVANLEKKAVVSPESVDIHDLTIAMAKARLSFNLTKGVIDRLISGWNEITTTR